MALKVLFDKRIKYIIKHGCPSDSIFEKNYKMFYFHARNTIKLVYDQIWKEFKQDFVEIPAKMKHFEEIK